MHVPGSRTMRRMLWWTLRRPAEELLRRSGLGKVIRPSWTPASNAKAGSGALSAAEWSQLQQGLSERGGVFYSDNLVSNESSYLQPAAALGRLPPGLAYIGVGPEQTFSYAAILKPALAFVVDVQKDNLRLHRLYKSLFEEAATRREWLALLLGRRHDAAFVADEDATLEEVLLRIERLPAGEAAYREAHARLLDRLSTSGPELSRTDRRRLDRLHRRFAEQQLDISFQLRRPSRQSYPSLRSLLLAVSPEGQPMSFLANARSYREVRRLQQQHRIVPVVGNLAGEHAIPGIAAELRRRRLEVGVVYASNVEQYLFEDRRWHRWVANLAALPHRPESVVLRSYLDQGRPHPQQMPGHRMTTVMQPLAKLIARNQRKSYRSYWELVTDDELRLPERSFVVPG